VLALTLIVAFSSWVVAADQPAGQEKVPQPPGSTDADQAAKDSDAADTAGTVLTYVGEYHGCRCRSLIGKPVHDAAGSRIGAFKDLAIDPDTGQVAYGVLSFGGFLGMGDKLLAIPWRSFEFRDDGQVRMGVTEAQLEQAEGFDPDDWPDMADEQWARATHATFDQDPYWQRDVPTSQRTRAMAGRTSDERRDADPDRADAAEADDAAATAGAGGGEDPMKSDSDNRRIVRMSRVLGAKIHDLQREDLGEIEDVVVDTGAGRIAYVVLDSGGLLEIGTQLAAAPWDALEVPSETELVLKVAKEKLNNAPRIDKGDWPDEDDKSYVIRLYRYYGMDPYWDNQDMSRRVSRAR